MQDPRSVRYDAIVVGSGATGGWAAKKLSEAGLKVALLEAGRKVSPDEFAEHLPAYRLDYRNLSPEIVKPEFPIWISVPNIIVSSHHGSKKIPASDQPWIQSTHPNDPLSPW